MLSDSESSDSNDDKQQLLTINETFAKAYKVRKEREELSKRTSSYCVQISLLRLFAQ